MKLTDLIVWQVPLVQIRVNAASSGAAASSAGPRAAVPPFASDVYPDFRGSDLGFRIARIVPSNLL